MKNGFSCEPVTSISAVRTDQFCSIPKTMFPFLWSCCWYNRKSPHSLSCYPHLCLSCVHTYSLESRDCGRKKTTPVKRRNRMNLNMSPHGTFSFSALLLTHACALAHTHKYLLHKKNQCCFVAIP